MHVEWRTVKCPGGYEWTQQIYAFTLENRDHNDVQNIPLITQTSRLID